MSVDDVWMRPLAVLIGMTIFIAIALWALYRRWLAHEQLDEIRRRERLRILLRRK